MIKLLSERKSHDENTDMVKITVGIDCYDDEMMQEVEHLLTAFFRTVYKESGKRTVCHAIMATRDAIQNITDEIFGGGKHGEL